MWNAISKTLAVFVFYPFSGLHYTKLRKSKIV